MCLFSTPKAPKPPETTRAPAPPPPELTLDRAAATRRTERKKTGSDRAGRAGLRVDLSFAGARSGSGLRLGGS